MATFGNNGGVDYSVNLTPTLKHADGDATDDYKTVSVLARHTLNVDLDGGTGVSTPQYGWTGDSVDLGTPSKTGYTFNKWEKTSGSGTLSGNSYTFVNEASAGVKAKWTLNNYTVKFDGNGATGGSTADQGFTYGTAQDLRANGFTRAYTVTYNHNYTGSTNTSATATYTFKNWMGASNAIVNETATYTGTGTDISSGYKDIKQWTASQPFAAGQKFILEFDAKGTGSFINYFYGASGYLQCSNATSSEGVTSSGSDGNITHTLTDEFKHYTITWTLGSTGNGAVNKYVLFRIMNGNNTITFKNVKFYKAELSSGNVRTFSNQQNVNNLTATANGIYWMVADWTPASVTLPSPTRTAYTFGGWYKEAACSNLIGNGGASYTPKYNLTMYAKWTPVQYTITYDTDGGNTIANKTYTIESTDTLPTPTKNGYTFAGWKPTTSVGSWSTTSTYNAGTSLTGKYGTVTLKAQWNINTYTITYTDSVSNGTSASGTLSYKTTDTSTLKTPTKDGYTFVNWKVTTADGSWAANATFNGGTSVNGKYGNPTLQAQWTANTITITLNNQGATSAGSTAVYYKYYINTYYSKSGATTTITKITVPTKTGYIFQGYYSAQNGGGTKYINADGTFANDLYKAYSSNNTLYAYWTPIKYNIAYSGNGSTGGTAPTIQSNISYDTDATLSANSFTRAYVVTFNANGGTVAPAQSTATYVFAGWKYNGTTYQPGDTVSNLTATNGATVTMEAQWTEKSVNLPTPTRDGYTFKGWHVGSLSGTKLTGTTYTPTATTTLVAEWEANTYTATFNANGGTVTPATKNYTIAQSLALPTPTRTGYTFTGWKVTTAAGNWTANTVFETDELTVAAGKWGDVTFTAQWNADPFKVHFVGTNATSGSMQDQYFLYTDTKNLSSNGFQRTYTVTFDENYEGKPTPLATATSLYAIDGWATEANGAKVYGDAASVSGSALFPGKNGTKNLYIVWKDGDVTLPGGNRAGYYIEGWYRTVSGSTYTGKVGAPGDTYKPTESETLFAKWEPITYDVEYNANTGTGTAPASHTNIIYNQEITIAANTFTKTGYHFTGWNTKADGSGTPYNENQTASNLLTVAGTVTLYAQWAPNTYTLTYNYNYPAGYDARTEDKSATYDAAWPTIADPTLTGYDFGGWYNEAACTTAAEITPNYTIAGNKTVYAKWTPKTYTVKFDANGGEGTKTYDNVAYDSEWPAAPTAPELKRNGYAFGGWFTDADCTEAAVVTGQFKATGNVTVYAKWTPITYTITYQDSHNKFDQFTQTYNIESTDVLASRSETGYDFAGWHVKIADADSPWAGDYAQGASVTGKYGNVTLESKWTAHQYNIVYDANKPKDSKGVETAGSVANLPGPATKTYGTDFTVSTNSVTLTGYTFNGYNTAANGTGTAYAKGSTMTTDHASETDATVTLYAQWVPNTYTVTFNGNGSTTGSMDDQGFTYDVWQNIATNQFGRAYTVTYNHNYTGSTDTSATATAAFNGWAESASGAKAYDPGENVKNLTTSGTKELFANWTLGSVTLETPAREGWTFGGWYTDADCTVSVGNGGASYTPTADITIYAKWTANEYTVTYDANTTDTTVAGIPADQTKTYATNLTLASGVPTRDGYTFLRWNTAADGNGTAYLPGAVLSTDYATGAEDDDSVTLYAVWEARTYVIDYAKGDGESGSTGSQTIRYDQLTGKTLAANGFTYPGYTFIKWQDKDNVQYDAGAAVTSALLLKGVLDNGDGFYHLTLTAQWKQNGSTLKIDHDNSDAVITVDQKSGTTYNVNGSFTKTGYTFNGWTLTGENGAAANGSVNDLSAKAPVYTFGNTDDLTDTLTAQWTKNPYTIVYHYNLPGATDNTRSVTVHYDEEFHFADALFFTATGYTIDGWARTADATTYEFDCGASNLNNGVYTNLCTGEGEDTSIDLYAVWEAKHYNVTFNANTGFTVTDTTNPKDVIYNGSVTFTVQLAEGYTQATATDINARITSGTGAIVAAAKDTANNTITYTVTNHGEADIVVTTDPLEKNVYTVTLQHENGSFDSSVNGYNQPTVQATVVHGEDVTFAISLLAGFHVENGADLIKSVTVGGTSVTPAVSGSYSYTVANATGNVVITLKDALKNQSTVKFDAKGGKIGDVEIVTETQGFGGTYTVAVPTREGYTFAGWTRSSESTANGSLSGNTYTFGNATGTDIYEAQWTANNYTITFSQETAAGDPAWAVITKGTLSKPVTFDGAMPAIDNLPTRVGYDFLGYTYTDGGTDYRYNASGAVVGEDKYTTAGNTTLYAKWQPHVYSITLDGTPVGYTVAYPQNAGYNDNYTFTITPNAGYDVNAINVNVTGNGGFTTAIADGVMTVSVTGVTADNVITVSGAMLTYNIVTNLVNSEAFAAQPATITVNYNTSGVTVEVTMADGYQQNAPEIEVVTTQTGLTASAAKKTGTDATYVITLSDPITADVTLNLTGKKNTYTVTLYGSEVGYTLPGTTSGSIEYLGNATYVITLADGYTQTTAADISVIEENGHAVLTKTDDTHIQVVITSEQPGDVTVTLGDAKENTYTLTFINNGGDTLTLGATAPAASSIVKYSDTLTFDVTLAEGYDAATPALTSDPSVTINAVKNGSTVTYTVSGFRANTVLTLAPAAANTSKVTVNLGGGTLTGVTDGAEYTGAYKETKSFGKPEKTGYTFNQWVLGGANNGTLADAASASATYTFGKTANAADTLTATYTPNTYTVTYYKNDGTSAAETQTVTFDAVWTALPNTTFTREGYEFAGWFVGPNDADAAFTFPATYTTAGNTNIYAHWTAHTSKLVVNPNGGKVTVDNNEYNNASYEATKAYGQTSTVGTPSKTGYTFNGWDHTGDGNGTLASGVYTFGTSNGTTDTYTANWTPKTYTVTFNGNGGTPPTTEKTATYDAKWPDAVTVTRTGYTFTGWYTAAEGGTAIDFNANYVTDGDTTVYAHWTINRSTVTFDPTDGTISLGGNTYSHTTPYSVSGDYNTTAEAPTPTRDGYDFAGWTRSDASTGNGTLTGSAYTFGSLAGKTDLYTATWTPKTYTVIFDGNGGAPTSQSKTATYNAQWPTATEPTRTGYDFAGWFTDAENGTQVDLSKNYTLLTGTTVFAHWTIHTSKVIVDLNGGTGTVSGERTQAYNTTLDLGAPTKTGYTFGGWVLTGDKNGSMNGNVYTFGAEKGKTDTVTAQWTPNTFTVTYHYNVEGTDTTTTQNLTYDQAAAALGQSTFTRTGWTLDKWNTAADGDGTDYAFGADIKNILNGSAGNTNIDFYAVWSINYSTVTFDPADGTLTIGSNTYTHASPFTKNSFYGDTVTIPDPVRTGFTFKGWTKSGNNGTLENGVYTFGAAKTNDTFTATWEANKYTVRYEKNDGTGAYATEEVTYGQAWPTAPTFNRTGYTAAEGWFNAAGGNTTVDMSGTYNTAADTTVYKHWTANEYTITYLNNGETTTAAYTIESTGALPVLTRDGYTFGGWKVIEISDETNWLKNNVYNNETHTGKYGDVTVEAQWTPKTYTVTYVKNDDTADSTTLNVTFDAAWPAAPTFTRTGYDFAGWYTAAENGNEVAMTGTYTTVGNTTVYAHWTIHTSTLKVDPNGGSVMVNGSAITAETSYTQDYNTTIEIAEPTREGWHFTGWTKSVTNGTFADGTYTFGAGKNVTDTLKAEWEIDTFTVTLTKGAGYVVTEGPQSPVDWNTSSYVTIKLVTGYTNSAAPAATVNGAALAAVDNGDGTFTYTVTGIKENKVIVIGDATKNTYNVTFSKTDDAVGISAYTPGVTVEHGTGTATVTVTLEDAYSASDAPEITLNTGSAEISGGVKSVVDGKTVYTYTVSNVTEASSFKIGPASPNTYTVSLNATRVGYEVTTMPAVTVLYDGTVTVAITLLEGYSQTDASTIPHSASNGDISFTRSGNVITYTVSHIKANTEINIGSATINKYDIALNADGTGYTVSENPAGQNVVEYGGSATVKLTLAEGYDNTSIPTVTVKNAANEDIGTAIGSKVGNEITYIVTNITDDVTITVGPASINTYVVSINTGIGAQIQRVGSDTPYNSGDTVTVDHGTEFRFTLADPTLHTPVYVNGIEAHADANGVYSVTVKQNTIITTDNLMYVANFVNDDGTFFASYIVVRGNTAVCFKGEPTKASTYHHDYVFSGWLCVTPEGDWAVGENMKNMTEDRVFKATYTTYHKNLPIVNDGTHHWYECPECGYIEGKEEHIPGGVEVENYVEAMCTVQGSHDEVVYCAVCRHELSRTTVNDGYDYTKHTTTKTYSEVLYDATCSETGMKVYYCVDCDHVVRYEEIPVNPANHSWNAWIDNGDGTHSRGCAYCGETNKQTKPHSLREIYRSAPTCVSEGCIVSLCPDCATVITETLPATGKHTPGDVMWLNYTSATCVSDGGYDAVTYCNTCGEELSNEHVTLEATGIHEYDVSYDPEPTCTTDGKAVYTCRYCDDSYEEVIKASGAHTVTNWTITKTPTESDPVGSHTGVCDACGETITEEIYFKPAGQRFVQFIGQDGVTYSVVNYDTKEEQRVSGTVTYYTNVTLKFYVAVNSQFAYSDYDVYVDGNKISQNADGSYSIPASATGANVKVVGTIPAAVNPGDSGVDNGSSTGKLSFWQRIIAFFRSIGDFFRNMFSR